MEYLKNVGKSLIYMILIIIVSTFIITILSYFNILNNIILPILKLVIILCSTFVGGFIIGKHSKQKGWLEGMKLGLIFIVILVLFNYLGLQNKFLMVNLIYYLITLISCTLGSMIGINKNQN